MVRPFSFLPACAWLLVLSFVICDAFEPILYPDEDGYSAVIEMDAMYEPPPSLRVARGARPMGSLGYYRCSAPEGYPGSCKPRSTCASYYSTTANYDAERPDRYKSCNYGYGYHGVCCPDVFYTVSSLGRKPPIIKIHPTKRPGYIQYKQVEITVEQLKQAIRYADVEINKGFKFDKHLGRGEDDDSYWGNGAAQEIYMAEIHQIGWAGYYIVLITTYLANEYGYNPGSYYSGGLRLDKYAYLLPPDVREVCQTYDYKKCAHSKYRTLDGTCNNLRHPYWGAAKTPITRLTVPEYSDNIFGMKIAPDGSDLPKARLFRSHVMPEKSVSEPKNNALFTNWGQVVVHDGAHTVFYQTHDGLFADCCFGYKGGRQQVSPKCCAIAIPKDDAFYKTTNTECLNLARTAIAPNYHCAAGYASQLNKQSALIDLSITYGTTKNESDGLRTGEYGMLKMSKIGDEYLLPIDPKAECFNTSNGFCLTCGDLRCTLHPGVTLIQTLMARNHNYCCKKLHRLNPHWADEKIFQECRKVNVGVFQHITYNEYLPLLLGWTSLYEAGILPTTKGFSYDYDEYVNPALLAEFSGAAMRCHSAVNDKISLVDDNYVVEQLLNLKDNYNDPSIFKKPENFEKVLRGYMHASMRKLDPYYDGGISLYMLRDQRKFGLDMASINMVRQRDLSLRSYNDYREMCGIKRANDWNDFLDLIEPQNVEQLRKFYKQPDHVELYVAGLMEKPKYDSVMGPTWWCIVAEQFKVWKQGDRFFYDLGDQPHSFTIAQLDSIRQISMAGLICQLTKVTHVPAFAFHTVTAGNPLIACSDYEAIPRLQFGPWKETRYTKY